MEEACHLLGVGLFQKFAKGHDLVGHRWMLRLLGSATKPLPVIRDDHRKPLARLYGAFPVKLLRVSLSPCSANWRLLVPT
jgi:hypothetical protein